MSPRSVRRTGALLVPALAVLVLTAGPMAAATGPRADLGSRVLPAVGPGYAILEQGPINASTLASSAPDPSAVSSALATLGGRVQTYQRVWIDAGHHNAVQDMLFHFPDAGSARIFQDAAARALESGKIATSGALAGIPGARRVTYFGATNQAGVGQAVAFRVGDDVDLLSFFSSSGGNAAPISAADGAVEARSQYRLLQTALSASTAQAHASGTSDRAGALVIGLVAVAVVLAVVAGVVLARRRRPIDPEAAGTPGA